MVTAEKAKLSIDDILSRANSIVNYVNTPGADIDKRATALTDFLELYRSMVGLQYDGAPNYLRWYDKQFLNDCGISAGSKALQRAEAHHER